MPILLPEVMTRFKCNEKGCCCRGWDIPFTPEEVGVLLSPFAPETREEVLEGAAVKMGQGEQVEEVYLRQVGPTKACQFLEPEGQCEVHRRVGPQVLPHLCVAFPAFAQKKAQHTELHFDAMCPEVLARLDEGDDALVLVEVDPPPDHHLSLRARKTFSLHPILLGERIITEDQLSFLRNQILNMLAEQGRGDVLTRLAALHYGLAEIAQGAPVETFNLSWERDPAEFLTYFETCLSIHQDQFLAWIFRDYRRFVFDINLERVDFTQFHLHLGRPADWKTRLQPSSPQLEPLLLRWLTHRVFSAFDRSPIVNEMSLSYGTIAHCLATAFRLTLGLSSWLQRPVDRVLLKTGLGGAEFIFRTCRVPISSMPWWTVGGQVDGLVIKERST